MSNKIKDGGMHAKRVMGDIITYIFLIVLSVIWLIPFFWLVMQSFRDGKGQFISTFLPKAYTVNNYKALFTQFDVMNFPRMFMNTFFIACCTCVISTFFVLSVRRGYAARSYPPPASAGYSPERPGYGERW